MIHHTCTVNALTVSTNGLSRCHWPMPSCSGRTGHQWPPRILPHTGHKDGGRDSRNRLFRSVYMTACATHRLAFWLKLHGTLIWHDYRLGRNVNDIVAKKINDRYRNIGWSIRSLLIRWDKRFSLLCYSASWALHVLTLLKIRHEHILCLMLNRGSVASLHIQSPFHDHCFSICKQNKWYRIIQYTVNRPEPIN